MHQFEILVTPVLTLLGLAFAFSSILRVVRNQHLAELAFGTLFGVCTIIAMTFPITLSDGIIFDVRSLLLGSCVLFAGWRAGLIALVMAISYRMHLGGSGSVAGIFGLCLAFAIASLWWKYVQPRVKPTMLMDILFGLTISLSLLALFVLPWAFAISILAQLTPILTAANVVGSVAIGYVLRRETKIFQDAETLRMLATTDPLTKLLNRRGNEQELNERAKDARGDCSLLYFDVDHFKEINDQYGHAAGDKALETIAKRLKRTLRQDVVLSRYGGDEFTAYLDDVSQNETRDIAERIRRTISSTPMFIEGNEISISVSIGGFHAQNGFDFTQMLREADAQLSKSKAIGRNCANVESGSIRTEPAYQTKLVAATQ